MIIAWHIFDSAKEEEVTLLPPDKPNYPLMRRGDFGTALHKMESKNYATYMNDPKYVVVGNWKCSNCGNIIFGEKPVTSCTRKRVIYDDKGRIIYKKKCLDGARWEYDECPLRAEEIKTSGTADLVLVEDGHTLVIVDYKSKDQDFYNALVERKISPPYGNRVQLQIYMAALRLQEWTKPYKYIRGVIDFVNMSKPNQEFEVPVPFSQTILETLLEEKKEIDYYIKTATVPPRRINGCQNDKDKIACECPFRELCFSLENKTIIEILGGNKDG